MVRHVILWNLKEMSAEEMLRVKQDAKKNLEALVGVVPGLEQMRINIDPLPSSNCDMMLCSLHKDAESLKEYSGHPAHVKAADTYVRPFTASRVCFDFEVDTCDC